ncbi:uncharacterized protein LOC120422830 [Culex pipiens pallens]|uniref:uncharacterized protein LOC120422830 n=1 Tax=Culex pipiens pallens TaxID=42434 RepID=UPI001952A951|nr:uncharacterized protein LOC120422830 [Culex pipiens pallens]
MDQSRISNSGPHYAAGPSLIPSLVRQREPDSSPAEMAQLCRLLLASGFLEYEAQQISRLQYCTAIQFFRRDDTDRTLLVAPFPLRISIRQYPERWFDETFYQQFQAYLLKCVADLDHIGVPRPQIASQMLVAGYMLLLVRDRAGVSTLQKMIRNVRFQGWRMKEPTVSERQAFYYGAKVADPSRMQVIPLGAAPKKKKVKNRSKKQNKALQKVREPPKVEELNYEAGYDPGSCRAADSVDALMDQRYDELSNSFFHEDQATDSLINFQAAD